MRARSGHEPPRFQISILGLWRFQAFSSLGFNPALYRLIAFPRILHLQPFALRGIERNDIATYQIPIRLLPRRWLRIERRARTDNPLQADPVGRERPVEN